MRPKRSAHDLHANFARCFARIVARHGRFFWIHPRRMPRPSQDAGRPRPVSRRAGLCVTASVKLADGAAIQTWSKAGPAGVSAIRLGRRDPDDDFILTVEAPFPKIPPGVYEAVSTSVRRRRYHNRPYLEALFDIFQGHIEDGVLLARGVPAFFSMPRDGQPLGRSSRLARWIQLLDPKLRLDRVPLRALKQKFWLGQVVTVDEDGQQQPLSAGNQYSKVAAVLERLA